MAASKSVCLCVCTRLYKHLSYNPAPAMHTHTPSLRSPLTWLSHRARYLPCSASTGLSLAGSLSVLLTAASPPPSLLPTPFEFLPVVSAKSHILSKPTATFLADSFLPILF